MLFLLACAVEQDTAGSSGAGVSVLAEQTGASGSYSGVSLAVGDGDGDGHEELLVGQTDPDGVVCLVTQAADGGLVEQWKGAGMGLGRTVDGGADLDGDGVDDWLVGAPLDGTAGPHGGAAWVVPGETSRGSVRAGHRLYVSDYHHVGVGLASLGDTDGDGYDDLAVGASGFSGWRAQSGAVFLLTGPITANTRLTSGSAWFGPADGRIGRDVHGVGDLDGDGLAEAVVATPTSDQRASNAGAVYIIGGGDSVAKQGLYAASARLVGRLSEGYAGTAIASGDVDGDGYTDLLVGAPGENDWRGSVYVAAGPLTANATLSTSLHARLTGTKSGDGFGSAIAVNGTTVYVGAPDRADGAGGVYVFAGPVSGVQRAHHATLLKGSAGAAYGASLATVPSNGWLAVGAPTQNTDQGAVYLLELP